MRSVVLTSVPFSPALHDICLGLTSVHTAKHFALKRVIPPKTALRGSLGEALRSEGCVNRSKPSRQPIPPYFCWERPGLGRNSLRKRFTISVPVANVPLSR